MQSSDWVEESVNVDDACFTNHMWILVCSQVVQCEWVTVLELFLWFCLAWFGSPWERPQDTAGHSHNGTVRPRSTTTS